MKSNDDNDDYYDVNFEDVMYYYIYITSMWYN